MLRAISPERATECLYPGSSPANRMVRVGQPGKLAYGKSIWKEGVL